MLKKLLIIFCFISIYQSSTVYSATISKKDYLVKCSPQLQKNIEAIQQIPEARELIATIQKEGPISIKVNEDPQLKQFGAFWDAGRRIIHINKFPGRSEGEIIGAILFELHNALMNSKLNHLDYLASSGKIDRANYVESVERVEYQNSKNASALAEKGILLGVLPKNAKLPTYSTFEEHFRIQQTAGHSGWIARTYDQLTAFKRYSL